MDGKLDEVRDIMSLGLRQSRHQARISQKLYELIIKISIFYLRMNLYLQTGSDLRRVYKAQLSWRGKNGIWLKYNFHIISNV